MIEIKEWRLITEDFRLTGAPMIIQVAQMNEILDRLEAVEKERDALRNEIACVKEVEFPRKAQAVADAWEGKCKRLEAERDALRAKVESMERQVPIAYMPLVTVAQLESGGSGVVWCPHDRSVSDVPVYALPGAQGEEK